MTQPSKLRGDPSGQCQLSAVAPAHHDTPTGGTDPKTPACMLRCSKEPVYTPSNCETVHKLGVFRGTSAHQLHCLCQCENPSYPLQKAFNIVFSPTYPQPEAFCKLTTYHQITITYYTSSKSLHRPKTDDRGSIFSHRKCPLQIFLANYFVACDSEAENQKDRKSLQQFISHYNCVDIMTFKMKHYISELHN